MFLGLAAGLLNVGLFHAVSRGYHADAAGTVNRGGIWYGLGCFTATIFAAIAFYANTAGILSFMAAVPVVFAVIYARRAESVPIPLADSNPQRVAQDFRSPAAVLFALLLFFQFGNEWSIAGWLPLLLIRRVGMPPGSALLVLALYWLCLMTGRLGAVSILPRVRHGRVLAVSVLAAFCGCLLLYFTNNTFGAAMGAFLVGVGFASIYPLVAEAIGHRFPYYHPGVFNGIFSIALLGGLLAPATLGYVAAAWGVGAVVGLPLIGSCAVVALLLLIWLESKVTGR
jgi:fucose permease